MGNVVLTTTDADKVLRVLRNEYQKIMVEKNEHEDMLMKYQNKEADPNLGEIVNAFREQAEKHGMNIDFDKEFYDRVNRDISDLDSKLSEIEYAIMVMTIGSKA